MSLKSWRKEFYKVDAKDVSEADALEHSILKWRGLLPSNLKRHKLRADSGNVIESIVHELYLRIDSDTCALCVHHVELLQGLCANCPLSQVREDTRCDWAMNHERRAPYHDFTNNNNPKPMLKWLRRAKVWRQKGGKP
jgi:hypothetical protein